MRELSIYDFEDLWSMATDLVYRLLMDVCFLDEEGNYIGYNEEKAGKSIRSINENLITKYLNFRECRELKELDITDVMELTADEIKQKYLYAALPVVRKIMRTDNLLAYGCVASDSIPDDYLDTLFAMAWQSDLKIWVLRWSAEKRIETGDEMDTKS